MSQAEIARELQVSQASISLDIQYLREQAKGTIKEYVTEHLPEQYQVCLTALDTYSDTHLRYWKPLDSTGNDNLDYDQLPKADGR